jgi:hypothetical protein
MKLPVAAELWGITIKIKPYLKESEMHGDLPMLNIEIGILYSVIG